MSTVSVVIPAYNRAAVIERAVHSVQAQSYPAFEIVIADDGSSDATATVVAKLASEDRRVRYVRHESNRGAQAARNLGIRNSSGEWIAFLDSDDEWLPDSLGLRMRRAHFRGINVVHSECYILYPGRTEPEILGEPAVYGRAYRKLLRRYGPTFPSLLAPREALIRIGGLDESIIAFQEWETSIRLSKHYRFIYVPEPTFIYYYRQAASISMSLFRTAQGYEQIITKHRWPILRHLGTTALAEHFKTASALYAEAKDESQASRCHWLARLVRANRPETFKELGGLLTRASPQRLWRWLRQGA